MLPNAEDLCINNKHLLTSVIVVAGSVVEEMLSLAWVIPGKSIPSYVPPTITVSAARVNVPPDSVMVLAGIVRVPVVHFDTESVMPGNCAFEKLYPRYKKVRLSQEERIFEREYRKCSQLDAREGRSVRKAS